MSIVLCIETALETAIAGIACDGKMLSFRENNQQKDHASFLQPAIKAICEESGHALSDLSAVSVVSGPGSYTGLRVGMAAAKGICFALQLPLITIPTLRWMAMAGAEADAQWVCPMIDARRMEVFTALYDTQGNVVQDPFATILDETLFTAALDNGKIVFFGGGAAKFQAIQSHPNAIFLPLQPRAADLASLSCKLLQSRDFSDLSSTVPQYGKEFFSPSMPKRN